MRRLKRRRHDMFRPKRRRRWPGALWKSLVFTALAFTGWHWGQAAIIHAKAWLAPVLIERAWTESRTHSVDVRPWPWADTWPVAKLIVPSLDIEQYVLAGTNGAALPFGPGHLTGSAQPGNGGTVVIAGHRDTHFAFLPRLDPGSIVVLESIDGRRRSYSVNHKALIDARIEDLDVDRDTSALVLVTCEPASVLSTRGPYRLIVRAY